MRDGMAGVLHLLTGATSCGKKAVAICLAERLGGEIVSLDSMKVYRGMDIGTAKPTMEDRRRVRHHMIDIVDPSEPFSLAKYLGPANEAERSIEAQGKTALFSGGTGLYARGLLYGIFDGPSADRGIREELAGRVRVEGREVLHRELRRLDPAAAARIHPNDEKRLVRGIEVIRLTGRPLSALQTQHGRPEPARKAKVAALRRDAGDLRQRIDVRVQRMFDSGLVEEVRGLRERLGHTARAGVGYGEVLELLDGVRSLQETIEGVRRRTWRLARKQMTWIRSFQDTQWIDVGPDDAPRATADRILHVWAAQRN